MNFFYWSEVRFRRFWSTTLSAIVTRGQGDISCRHAHSDPILVNRASVLGDTTVAAGPIVTLSSDAETKRPKREAAAKRQRACRVNEKANNGVEATSKKRKAEPWRQTAARSKKEKAEQGTNRP